MSRGKIGWKAARVERNRFIQDELRVRRQLRRRRAAIHAAMQTAAKMVRSKQKGTRDFEANMRSLGYAPRGDLSREGRTMRGDVLNKYEAMR